MGPLLLFQGWDGASWEVPDLSQQTDGLLSFRNVRPELSFGTSFLASGKDSGARSLKSESR
jgi:hypothetical protein